jgi:hypothetical protein
MPVRGEFVLRLESACETDLDMIYLKRHFDAEIIVLCVRWYITYKLSYWDLFAIMAERAVVVSHTTIMRWVIRYAPESRSVGVGSRDSVGYSWRVDETYIAARATGTIFTGRSISMAVRWISRYGPIVESQRRKHSFARPSDSSCVRSLSGEIGLQIITLLIPGITSDPKVEQRISATLQQRYREAEDRSHPWNRRQRGPARVGLRSKPARLSARRAGLIGVTLGGLALETQAGAKPRPALASG